MSVNQLILSPLKSRLRGWPALAAIAALLLLPPAAWAQGKLTPAQEQGLAQCLVGCNKGDAACQDGCTEKNVSSDFSTTAGACVRACADALAVPAQQNRESGDLVTCLRACD